MKYPNGETQYPNELTEEKPIQFANRGMDFEKAVTASNRFYDDQKRALITKRPTPIHIVHVDYKRNCRITDAYFEKQSTTDYNGIYRGRYVDFECKETKSATSLSFHNIGPHQVAHLEKVLAHGGIAFFLIYFITLGEVYLLDAAHIVERFRGGTKKSISLSDIRTCGHIIEQGYIPRLNYLDVVDKVYFDEKKNL